MDILQHNSLEGDRPDLVIDLHDGSDEQISIIIVHKDKPEYLTILLQSIVATTLNKNYEIIVVDNSSTTKESEVCLADLEDCNYIKVIRNDRNIYFGPAANLGANAASKHSKYLVFMHCDVVIENGSWLDLMITVSESQKSGLVGLELQSYAQVQAGQKQKMDFIPEWCMLMTKDCWKSIGPFPEQLPQIGTGFLMTRKAQLGGFEPKVLNSRVCFHYQSGGIDINEWERLNENASAVLPQLLRNLQTKSV